MRVNFRYPAMVTTANPGAATAARTLVSMLGQADVPELSTDDAPVAAIVHPIGAFRFYEGKLYRQTRWTKFHPRRCGLDREMGRAICERLLDEKAYNAALQPNLGYATGREISWSLWRHSRDRLIIDRVETGQHEEFPDELWDKMKPYDPSTMDGDNAAHWSSIATDYVESLIVVDGTIWLPSDEPMIRTALVGLNATSSTVWDDASCYRNGFGRPCDLPPPYGSNEWHSAHVYNLHAYWNPRCRYVPFPQAVVEATDRGMWVGDLLMPEAFTTDHAPLQLERAARVVASCVPHILNDTAYAFHGTFIKHQKALKRLTKSRPIHSESEAIYDALAQLRDDLESLEGRAFALNNYLEKMNLKPFISEAMTAWEERPISLAIERGVSLGNHL